MRALIVAAAVLGVAPLAIFAQAAPTSLPDVVISGVMRDSDRGSYRELPFDVPAGVTKLTIDVQGADHKDGTYLVLGVYDPTRERGWGGAIKPHIVIAETFASTSYLPGPLPAGRWRLSVAVASIRPGTVTPYKMTVHFDRGAAAQAITPTALKTGPGWYRGDFHTHTGQSDALCRSEPSRNPVPCPVYFTLKAARDHKLDFVTVTDHNVRSQVAELANLAPFFDTLLVIPGREMTTQYGHFNLLGVTDFVEYRLGAVGAPDINAMFDRARGTGAIISINHPEIPTDENCIGCGWSAPGTDYARVGAVEVANGGIAADHGGAFDEGSGSGTAWWEKLLDRGFHLTGIGGSDNHDAIDGHAGTSPVGAQSPVGTPATVVYATDLSQAAILAGVRSGRVFIDLEGAHPGRVLDLMASTSPQAVAVMGGTLRRRRGQAIRGTVRVAGADGDVVDLIVDGRRRILDHNGIVEGTDARVRFVIPAGDKIRWLRADVRMSNGRRIVIGNPIYVVP
ncbi:CehA/McbA family metallohydrolase [Sphingomonas sp. PP-CC-3G-468]|uniref:CehA/McbA family metallohydrolase n=1 Tax=Sphingomonas sp. PP-CC-3G-468 TaxID=2135656 RepID=UPI00105156F9|nr:CehA/McbA family metallohydrolase [Sphingomonas sp. PP-CC-3G-468]TCM04767.1 putative metal-dependent phosphoesterase TrpH [Sphingomonas sp. PP-CC-3G-468]